MANIKVLNNKFIIEGHTSKEECDTLTQVANVLDKSKEFKTIEYKNGYAEFERVVNSEELKFVNDPMQTTFSWDAHISQISFYAMGATGDSFSVLYTSTNSGDMVQYMGNTSYSYTMTVNVVLEEGYVLDTITGEDTTISNITNTTFDFAVLGNFTMPGNIVITSKVNNPNIQIPITKNGKTTLATKGTKNAEDIDINVDIPTYITVASESALPSTAQEGTIAVVEGVAMYSVSCSSYADKVDTSLQTYYSTNNGSTWTEFTNAGILSNKTNQIKFRMTYPSGTPGIGTATLSSEQLGMTLSHSFSNSGFDITSDNYILTKDITDVTYNEDL